MKPSFPISLPILWGLLVLWGLLGGIAQATSAGEMPVVPRTRSPILYVIDYSDRHFTEPEYLDQFRAAPPDLLHMGKATPITHLWGPIRLLRGENQYTGGPGHTLSWENIELLSPEALAQRIELIRTTLARYHQAGIAQIVPYISYHTLAGDHEKRLGFWKFYDQWDQYAQWAGPRPKHDPFDWLVVDRQGQFVGGSCGGYSPDYFAPLHRYRACINHPDWAEWHRRLIRSIAEVGYDGCFVDNTHPDDCYCRYCRAWFRQFLQHHADLPWVRRFTEGRDTSNWQLDSPEVPAELVRRARLFRTSQYLEELRQVGRRIHPRFVIFPNGNNIHTCLPLGLHCDYNMFESTYSPGIMAFDEFSSPDRLTIVVADNIQPLSRVSVPYSVMDSALFIELQAQISFSPRIRSGQKAIFQVEVLNVGSSGSDGDWAEGFHVVLEEMHSKEVVRLDLSPKRIVGGSSRRPGTPGQDSQPPVRMRAEWTPRQAGTYAVGLGFCYTDESHLATTNKRPYVVWGESHLRPFCRTHVGTLLYAQYMQEARAIFLGYEARRKGWENVMELGLAEMAAFSGGGGFAASGPVQAKYRKFFKRYPALYAGWQMGGRDAVLLAWWGGNPLNYLRPLSQKPIHEVLSSTHRPMSVLVDATFPTDPKELTAFQTLSLEAPDYDLSESQQKAILEYVRQGGWLIVAHPQVAWNGRPVCESLGISPSQPDRQIGQGRAILWNDAQAIFRSAPIGPQDGRRANLRFALYQKEEQLALHVVNYNVCLLDPSKRILEVEETPVQLPLPLPWESVQAVSYCPDLPEPQLLTCKIGEGKVHFVLPRTRMYQVVLLQKTKGNSQ